VTEPPSTDDGPQFLPIRTTAARSLRPGDHILVHESGFPDTSRRGPHYGYRGRITDIREDEATCTITFNGELLGQVGLFEKQAHPWDMFDRLVQPGDPIPGSESKLVRVKDLWKWTGLDMNDLEGSPEKYVLRAVRRVHSDETGAEAFELHLQSKRDPRKVHIATFRPEGTVSFAGHR
jgi:hypothetical protein